MDIVVASGCDPSSCLFFSCQNQSFYSRPKKARPAPSDSAALSCFSGHDCVRQTESVQLLLLSYFFSDCHKVKWML